MRSLAMAIVSDANGGVAGLTLADSDICADITVVLPFVRVVRNECVNGESRRIISLGFMICLGQS